MENEQYIFELSIGYWKISKQIMKLQCMIWIHVLKNFVILSKLNKPKAKILIKIPNKRN
jgi:hypothetical protein